jgi:hypothetical protein
MMAVRVVTARPVSFGFPASHPGCLLVQRAKDMVRDANPRGRIGTLVRPALPGFDLLNRVHWSVLNPNARPAR